MPEKFYPTLSISAGGGGVKDGGLGWERGSERKRERGNIDL